MADAEKLADMNRGELGLKSAVAAAASGDVPRAIQLLRHIRATALAGEATPEFRTRVGERLAFYLMQSDEPGCAAEALRVIGETVEQAPPEPPSAARARAMATCALAWMVSGDDTAAREWAERARAEAARSGADWVVADILVTLGMISGREGNTEEAIGLFAEAHAQAVGTHMFGVELRAAYHLAATRLSRGDLAGASAAAHAGVSRADAEGLGLAPYGLDVQHLHFQAHYADGAWDHAEELARTFPVWVTKQPEAVLSAMALFIDVARGNSVADERRTWLEPFWDDVFVAYIARGLLAEQALWRGDTDTALAEAEAALARTRGAGSPPPPSGWRRSRLAPAPTARPPPARPGSPRPWPRRRRPGRGCSTRRARAPGSPNGRGPSSARRAAAGWPAPRRSTSGSSAGTTPRAGKRRWPSSASATCTRPRGRSGGWPRPWP